MYRVLLIEDAVEYQTLVQMLLRPVAEVVMAGTVKEALALTESKAFDLFLIDVMLEDGDGFTLASILREKTKLKDIPMIFLTSKNHINDKITGFKLGADDYIVKPFDSVEFRLRVESRLQKSTNVKKSDELVHGNLKLEVPMQKAYLLNEGQALNLTPLQFKILFFLSTHEKEVISRERLSSMIWGKDAPIGRSIDTHINSLRKKLGPYSNYIQSVYGSGYFFSSNAEPKLDIHSSSLVQ